jgi:hypothetical protein
MTRADRRPRDSSYVVDDASVIVPYGRAAGGSPLGLPNVVPSGIRPIRPRTRCSVGRPKEWYMTSDISYAGEEVIYADEEKGSGWIAFAGIMLMISGSVTFIQGLWALDHRNSADAKAAAQLMSYANLETWGWIALIWGTLVFFAGIAVFLRAQWARWVGVTAASISLVLMFFWVVAFPIAALTIMLLDTLVLYALMAYGGRQSSMA